MPKTNMATTMTTATKTTSTATKTTSTATTTTSTTPATVNTKSISGHFYSNQQLYSDFLIFSRGTILTQNDTLKILDSVRFRRRALSLTMTIIKLRGEQEHG